MSSAFIKPIGRWHGNINARLFSGGIMYAVDASITALVTLLLYTHLMADDSAHSPLPFMATIRERTRRAGESKLLFWTQQYRSLIGVSDQVWFIRRTSWSFQSMGVPRTPNHEMMILTMVLLFVGFRSMFNAFGWLLDGSRKADYGGNLVTFISYLCWSASWPISFLTILLSEEGSCDWKWNLLYKTWVSSGWCENGRWCHWQLCF